MLEGSFDSAIERLSFLDKKQFCKNLYKLFFLFIVKKIIILLY